MGMSHSTYVFYGVLVARHDAEGIEPSSYGLQCVLDKKFGEDTEFVSDGVRRFLAGDYDRDNLYLIIHQDGHASKEVKPGETRRIPPAAPPYVAESWNSLLRHACETLDLKPMSPCGWFVVPDVG